ncbi:MAG: T9SS type A sorting domain-containing protein [Bacteroidales bacterium]|nr:T9SS type A sorting domain-containing protein [Bacteroidales bacterium]
MANRTLKLLTLTALLIFCGNAAAQNQLDEEDILTIKDEYLMPAPYCNGVSYSIVHKQNSMDVLKIYNQKMECVKTVNIPVPSSATNVRIAHVYCMTNDMFTNNNKYEFVARIIYEYQTESGYTDHNTVEGIYNEDGECLYSFPTDCEISKSYPPYITGNKCIVNLEKYSGKGGYIDYIAKVFTLHSSAESSVSSVAYNNNSKVYPNPARHSVTLEYDIQGQMQNMQITDMQGRVVENYLLDPSRKQIRINTSDYKKGTYIYRYGNTSGKFIVQ